MPRIISGIYKKKKLKAPEGTETRPTQDRVKEALFSILEHQFLYFDISWENCIVLDLFAGSGQLALECLSRGAKKATLVDDSFKAKSIQKENIRSLNITNQCELLTMSVEKALVNFKKSDVKYNVVLLDPPYKNVAATLGNILDLLKSSLANPALVVCESPLLTDEEEENILKSLKILPLESKTAPYSLVKKQKYGQTVLYFFAFVI